MKWPETSFWSFIGTLNEDRTLNEDCCSTDYFLDVFYLRRRIKVIEQSVFHKLMELARLQKSITFVIISVDFFDVFKSSVIVGFVSYDSIFCIQRIVCKVVVTFNEHCEVFDLFFNFFDNASRSSRESAIDDRYSLPLGKAFHSYY